MDPEGAAAYRPLPRRPFLCLTLDFSPRSGQCPDGPAAESLPPLPSSRGCRYILSSSCVLLKHCRGQRLPGMAPVLGITHGPPGRISWLSSGMNVALPLPVGGVGVGTPKDIPTMPWGTPMEHGIRFAYHHHYPVLFIACPPVAQARSGFNVSIRPYLHSSHQGPKFFSPLPNYFVCDALVIFRFLD
jgi:hypothetical protein